MRLKRNTDRERCPECSKPYSLRLSGTSGTQPVHESTPIDKVCKSIDSVVYVHEARETPEEAVNIESIDAS